MDDFFSCWVCFGPHILSAHIFERAWAYCGMLRLCEGCWSCLCNSFALLMSPWQNGFSFCCWILRGAAISSAMLQFPVCPLRKRSPHASLSISLTKTPAAPLSITHPGELRSAGRLKIIIPINHPWALERRLAPCPPQSDSISDLSVSERSSYDDQTWHQCWTARILPVSAGRHLRHRCLFKSLQRLNYFIKMSPGVDRL